MHVLYNNHIKNYKKCTVNVKSSYKVKSGMNVWQICFKDVVNVISWGKVWFMSKIPNLFEIDSPPLNICSHAYFAAINLLFLVLSKRGKACQINKQFFPKFGVICNFILVIVTLKVYMFVLLYVHPKRDDFLFSLYLCSVQGIILSLPNSFTCPHCFLTAY